MKDSKIEVNDVYLQKSKPRFKYEINGDKLAIEAIFREVKYIGELPPNEQFTFDDVKELLDEENFKIVLLDKDSFEIKIGKLIPLKLKCK